MVPRVRRWAPQLIPRRQTCTEFSENPPEISSPCGDTVNTTKLPVSGLPPQHQQASGRWGTCSLGVPSVSVTKEHVLDVEKLQSFTKPRECRCDRSWNTRLPAPGQSRSGALGPQAHWRPPVLMAMLCLLPVSKEFSNEGHTTLGVSSKPICYLFLKS